MTFFVSYPISTLDPFQPSGLRPSGRYGSNGLIWGMIRKMSYKNLYIFNTSIINNCFISQQFEEFQSKSFIIVKQSISKIMFYVTTYLMKLLMKHFVLFI